MEASWNIVADQTCNLVRVRLSGFFSTADVAAFAVDFRAALAKLPAYGHLTLADLKGMKIQSQDVVQAFTQFMASPNVQSRKLAFVCDSTLARLQAQRLTTRDNVEFFDTRLEAESWLFQ